MAYQAARVFEEEVGGPAYIKPPGTREIPNLGSDPSPEKPTPEA